MKTTFSRRAFIKAGAAGVAALLLPQFGNAAKGGGNAPQLAPLSGGFSRQLFQGYVGQAFAAACEATPAPLSVRLEAVTGAPARKGGLECFDLLFSGPGAPVAGLYDLYHPAAGHFQLRLDPIVDAKERPFLRAQLALLA